MPRVHPWCREGDSSARRSKEKSRRKGRSKAPSDDEYSGKYPLFSHGCHMYGLILIGVLEKEKRRFVSRPSVEKWQKEYTFWIVLVENRHETYTFAVCLIYAPKIGTHNSRICLITRWCYRTIDWVWKMQHTTKSNILSIQ